VGSSSSSGKSGAGGGALNAAALFRRFNSSAPVPRAEAAGDGDGGVRLEIEDIAAGDRRRETRKRKSPLGARLASRIPSPPFRLSPLIRDALSISLAGGGGGGDDHHSGGSGKRVVVLGDDPKPRPAARTMTTTATTRRQRRGRRHAGPTGRGEEGGDQAAYNHYASGGGWWHGEMEGVDGEEVGWTDDMWEGMGSITLGGLEWH
jgi:hypothetical protein